MTLNETRTAKIVDASDSPKRMREFSHLTRIGTECESIDDACGEFVKKHAPNRPSRVECELGPTDERNALKHTEKPFPREDVRIGIVLSQSDQTLPQALAGQSKSLEPLDIHSSEAILLESASRPLQRAH